MVSGDYNLQLLFVFLTHPIHALLSALWAELFDNAPIFVRSTYPDFEPFLGLTIFGHHT